MGNVRTTPVLAPDTARGCTPAAFAAGLTRGTLPTMAAGSERYGVSGSDYTAEYGSGPVASGIRVTLTPSGTADAWDRVRVVIRGTADVQQQSREHVNRLIGALTGANGKAARLGVYWRTADQRVWLPGVASPIPTPVVVVATSDGSGSWAWSVDAAGTAAIGSVVSGLAATATLIGAAPVPAPAAVKPRRVRGSSAVPASRIRAAAAPVVAPAPAAPVVAPSPAPVAAPVPSAPALATTPGLFRDPSTLAPGFRVFHDPKVEAKLERAAKRHAKGERTVVLISGPTGVGKSMTAKVVAARYGLPFLQVDAAGMGTFADWAGAVSLDESASGIVTRYAPSLIVEAVRADGPMGGIPRMVLVDECNRVPTGSALNPLMVMTDGNGFLYVPDAKVSIPVDPAVMWVLTANIGSQYSATATIDAAMANRVTAHVPIGYPAAKDEARMLVDQGGCTLPVAEALVKVATQVRAMSANGTIGAPGVSTRQLISAAAEVAVGGTPMDGAEVGFIDGYDDEGGNASERAKVRLAASAVLANLSA